MYSTAAKAAVVVRVTAVLLYTLTSAPTYQLEPAVYIYNSDCLLKWVMLLQYLVLYGLVESIVGAVAFFVANTALSNNQVYSLPHTSSMISFGGSGCCL